MNSGKASPFPQKAHFYLLLKIKYNLTWFDIRGPAILILSISCRLSYWNGSTCGYHHCFQNLNVNKGVLCWAWLPEVDVPQFLLFPFISLFLRSSGEWREARGEYEKGGRRVEGSTRRLRERREASGGKHEASARKARGARHAQVDVFIRAPPFNRVSSLAFFSHLFRTFVLSRKKLNPFHELKCYNE